MAYLIAIAVTFALLVLFVLLTALETSQGFRILGGSRRALDRQVARVSYIATHVDWGAFSVHMARTTAERAAHDLVHATLLAVRAAERSLTRWIKTLRERVAHGNPGAETVEGSQLIATIVRFRKSLSHEKTSAESDRVGE